MDQVRKPIGGKTCQTDLKWYVKCSKPTNMEQGNSSVHINLPF